MGPGNTTVTSDTNALKILGKINDVEIKGGEVRSFPNDSEGKESTYTMQERQEMQLRS